jgi:ubiquinone/menaquinone biosynthesis C-methylase UbiE
MFSKLLFAVIASPKFKALNKRFKKGEEFKVLDVGCGKSAVKTKKYFRNCRYYGLDCLDSSGVGEEELKAAEHYYQIDLDKDNLSSLADNFFDAIIMTHTLEHIKNGLSVIEGLCEKLKKKGIIYIEFPSVRSLSLPSVEGTLNFCDDPGHIRIYDIKDVANVLLAANFKIIKAGPRRDLLKSMLTPLTYLYFRCIKRVPAAVSLWDICGFADYVLAEKK